MGLSAVSAFSSKGLEMGVGREHLCKNSRTLRMLCLCPQLVVNFFRKLCFFFNFCFCLVFIFVVFVFVLFLSCFSVFFFPL